MMLKNPCRADPAPRSGPPKRCDPPWWTMLSITKFKRRADSAALTLMWQPPWSGFWGWWKN
eukprot:6497667-Pyramimonas_sp.AAC.1